MTDRLDALRADVQAFVAEHLTHDALDEVAATGTYHDWGFAKALGARGWIVPGWPAAEGGADLDELEQAVLEQELQLAHAPIDGTGTTRMVASVLRGMGTPWQQELICGPVARGELLVALGYTEADAGSDVASVRTRARSVDGGWVIDGEKMFTTLAHESGYVFLLARTGGGDRHRGLTMFLVPTSAPGFSLTPIHTLSGERTNTTRYDGIELGDEWRVGEVDGGWQVLSAALDLEHAIGFGAALQRALLEATAELSDQLDDPYVASRLAVVAADVEVGKLLQREAAAAGDDPAVGPMSKLFSSESFARGAADLLDLLGERGLVYEPDRHAGGAALVELAYRHSQVTRIYAGTSEVQRSIIAERGLGLPRSR